MTRLSRYNKTRRAWPLAPSRRVVTIVVIAGAALALCLAQLHLKFALSDLQQETTRLQSEKMELTSKVNRLRSDVESYKRGDRLLAYARDELGMVDLSPMQVERITIPLDIQARYGNLERDLGKAHNRASELDSAAPLTELLASRVGLVKKAIAAGGGP